MLEAARDRERFVDGGQIAPALVERRANAVDIAKRREELGRARQQTFAVKQLQQVTT